MSGGTDDVTYAMPDCDCVTRAPTWQKVIFVPLVYLLVAVCALVYATCYFTFVFVYYLPGYLRGRYRVWYYLRYERTQQPLRLASKESGAPVQLLICPENQWQQ